MSLLARLFGRRPAALPDAALPAGPGADALPAAPAAVPGTDALPADETGSSEATAAAAQPAAQPAAPRAEAPSLRTLYRYQQDPAFNNFVDKLKRPPGLQRRTRMPNLDYPPPAAQKKPER
jgi:hypothetical protein